MGRRHHQSAKEGVGRAQFCRAVELKVCAISPELETLNREVNELPVNRDVQQRQASEVLCHVERCN
jgi:hypothetical protein